MAKRKRPANASPPAPEQIPYAPFAARRGGDAFTQQLRKETAAVRLTYSRFGIRRAIKGEPVAAMARVVSAVPGNVNASKRLLDTTHNAWRAAIGAIGRARIFWRTMSVPYPVKGVRLIRRDLIPSFDQAMSKFAAELHEGLAELRQAYDELRTEARKNLGSLFSASDYPTDVTAEFHLEWDYPSVEPPDYLKELNPALYAAAQARLEARFEEAARMAEDAFAAELHKLVTHLVDRLDGGEDGQKKRLNESAVKNLSEFFEKIGTMRVGSNSEFDKLIADARKAVAGVSVGELRKSDAMRRNLTDQMQAVQRTLDTMLVDRPQRSIDLSDESEDGE